jgi:hypothetical protein
VSISYLTFPHHPKEAAAFFSISGIVISDLV